MRNRLPRGITLVRVAVAVLLGIHGTTRFLSGGVRPFGQFLSETGFPLGLVIASAITMFEILAAPLLALGRKARVVAAGYIVILSMGILLVHAREGWFVVGGGRNGVEYSVLLIACLAAVIVDARST